jgi:O-antigen/teichoic acid export membrane protein
MRLSVETPMESSIPMSVLRRRAFLLGSANAFDYSMQFLLPVVLARTLSAEVFGQYRLLWLALMTVIAVVPLAMPQSLYYFLPRADTTTKRLYVHQTLLYLLFAGLLGGLLISPWNNFQPDSMRWFGEHGMLVPSLLLLLVFSSLLDLLPTIEERVIWQAGITISLSLVRAVTLSIAAFLTGDLRVLIWLLIALAMIKLLLLFRYVAQIHGLAGPWLTRNSLSEQFRHALPFGLSGALYGLRGQADQWVAASLFTLQSFASFSISAVLGPLVNLFRLSVNHVFLPSMSRLQAAGDVSGMLELNSRANVMVAALVYPVLAFAFVFAEELVTVVYTAEYLEAAAVMRVYIVSLAVLVVELVSITLLLKEGVFALRLNLVILALSIALSWCAAQFYGLPGAAVGSVVVIFMDRVATLRRIQRRTSTPLKHLQNWHALGVLMLFSALAALLAWAVTRHYVHHIPYPFQLLVGGVIVATAYTVMCAIHGIGRAWLFAVFDLRG